MTAASVGPLCLPADGDGAAVSACGLTRGGFGARRRGNIVHDEGRGDRGTGRGENVAPGPGSGQLLGLPGTRLPRPSARTTPSQGSRAEIMKVVLTHTPTYVLYLLEGARLPPNARGEHIIPRVVESVAANTRSPRPLCKLHLYHPRIH